MPQLAQVGHVRALIRSHRLGGGAGRQVVRAGQVRDTFRARAADPTPPDWPHRGPGRGRRRRRPAPADRRRPPGRARVRAGRAAGSATGSTGAKGRRAAPTCGCGASGSRRSSRRARARPARCRPRSADRARGGRVDGRRHVGRRRDIHRSREVGRCRNVDGRRGVRGGREVHGSRCVRQVCVHRGFGSRCGGIGSRRQRQVDRGGLRGLRGRGVERRGLHVESVVVDRRVVLGGLGHHVAGGRSRQSGAAHRPGATALSGQHALGDGDLLVLGGHVRGRGVLAAAVAGPGARRELQAALVAVAGVDGPVAAGFAAGDLVPFAVGGRTCVARRGQGRRRRGPHP